MLDDAWAQMVGRLDGLSDAEYRWEPVERCWTVRAREDGSVTVDGEGERELDPAPVTTIAWRLWHIGVDCLDVYSERLLGTTGASVSGDAWHLDATAAVDLAVHALDEIAHHGAEVGLLRDLYRDGAASR